MMEVVGCSVDSPKSESSPTRQSLLPAWLLQSQEILARVEISSARARESIARLDDGLCQFDALSAEPAAAEGHAAQVSPEAPAAPRQPNGPHLLPEELGTKAAAYMTVRCVVALSACDSALRRWYESDLPWFGEWERRSLEKSWWIGLEADDDDDDGDGGDRPPRRRAAVLHHQFLSCKSAFFLRHHSLVASNASSSQGRRKAHGLLEALVLVTATEIEAERAGAAAPTAFIGEIVKTGGLASLASIAGNESQAMAGLAAAAIANVLAHDDFADEASAILEGCDGRAILTQLLTSPSAKVALHIAISDEKRAAVLSRMNLDVNDDDDVEVLADSADWQSCQGSASKHAARALGNWCGFPDGCPLVASPTDAVCLTRFVPRLVAEMATVGHWTIRCYSRDGLLKYVSRLTIAVDPRTGRISGAGSDERGKFDISGATAPGEDASMLAFSANYHEFGTSTVGHFAYVLWSGVEPAQAEGLFGIWEVASHDSHFQLRSGGPCRCLPGMRTDPPYR